MHAVQDKSEVSIQHYLDVLRRRWLWVVVTPLLFGGLMLVRDLRAEPVYRSSTQLLLQAKQSESILSPTPAPADPERAIQNELRIINSRTIKEAVRESNGAPIAIEATAGGEDDVLVLSATASTADEAAERANTYARVYQATRLEALVADIAATKAIVQQQVDDFQAQVDAIDAPVAALDQQIVNTDPSDPAYAELVQQREEVKARTDAERAAAQESLDNYTDTLNQLQLTERLNTTGGVQILNPATPPGQPSSPTTIRDVLQALVVGLFLGIGLAFARDQFDDSLRTKDDLERAVKDLPVLGLVPLDAGWRNPRRARLVTQAAPMSAAAESYRGLRTSLQYASLHKAIAIVQVTSASAGEGKTALLSNLALAFAHAGKRVAVVGCDLRRPRLHQFMEVDGAVGFTSVVLGDVTLDDALQTSGVHPNIDVLASGPRPPNPSELLSTDRAAKVIEGLGERYSMVFIDCPPVLPVTDALVLSRSADATLFLTSANNTSRRTARRGVEMLRQVDSPLIGTILNGVAAEDTYGSFYEYYGFASPSRIPILGRLFRRRDEETPKDDRTDLPDSSEDEEQPPPRPDEAPDEERELAREGTPST